MPIMLRRGETQLRHKTVSLKYEKHGLLIDNLFKNIKLERVGDDQNGYHNIKIAHLDAGNYYLQVASGKKVINLSIVVHKGDLWSQNSSFILKKDQLRENVKSENIPKI